ncbi:MAG: hypothetical protein JNL58_25140 [Planctomyces sp.]|nr:hypothetical protein [Planctomyces sp.]
MNVRYLLVVCALSVLSFVSSAPAVQKSSLITREDLERALDMPCPELTDETEQISVRDLIRLLSDHMTKQHGKPIQIFPEYMELDVAGIKSLNDVKITRMNITAGTHTNREFFDLMLSQTTDPTLTWIPRQRHILLSTTDHAESDDCLETVVYDVSTLRMDPESLIDLFQEHTSPPATWFDIDQEGGRISAYGSRLVISQTYRVHRRIQQILKDLGEP